MNTGSFVSRLHLTEPMCRLPHSLHYDGKGEIVDCVLVSEFPCQGSFEVDVVKISGKVHEEMAVQVSHTVLVLWLRIRARVSHRHGPCHQHEEYLPHRRTTGCVLKVQVPKPDFKSNPQSEPLRDC